MSEKKYNFTKKILVVVAVILASSVLFQVFDYFGNADNEAPKDNTEINIEVNDDDKVFTVVDEMPLFSGGDKELFRFLGDNISYPKNALENGTEGLVYVSFIIDEEGAVKDAEILKGIGNGCDQEALRVVNSMPKWNPGKQNGETVKVKYNLPVRFQLK